MYSRTDQAAAAGAQAAARSARESGPSGRCPVAARRRSVVAARERLAEENVAAVAIAYLHAYANPAHEQRSADIAREVLGTDVFITCSSDILPEIREYERTSTTVINAYLGPILSGYFVSLQRHLKQIDVTAPVQVMKSDGGVMVAAATQKPAYIVESGPQPALSVRQGWIGPKTSSRLIWGARPPRPPWSNTAKWHAPATMKLAPA